MTKPEIILILTTMSFYSVGGMIDYWQNARHHNKPIPYYLKNYFALFWLILYSGLLPFLMVFAASNFNWLLIKKYIGVVFIGMSLWDFAFALLEKRKLVYGIKDYWFWGNKDYALTKNQLLIWHFLRLAFGLILVFQYKFF